MSEVSSFKDDPLFSRITLFLKEHLNPTRLYLYGSRAHGNARPDSDYDFVAVVPEFDSKKRHEMMSRISSQLWAELNVEVQVWVYSQAEFDDWKDEFSSIPETALNTGIEVVLG